MTGSADMPDLGEAVAVVRRLLEAVARGELAASAGQVERLEGAVIALESLAEAERLHD